MEWLGYPRVPTYKGLDLHSLPLNHAWVTVNTTVDNVAVYSVRDDCFNCPYKLMSQPKVNEPVSWQVDTSQQVSWRILQTETPVDILARSNKSGWLCQMRPTFEEYGVYSLDVGKCEVSPEVSPIHSYLPLLLCSLILLSICAFWNLANYLWKLRCQKKEENQEKVLQISREIIEESTPTLNVFRGLLLFLVIFSTTGGGGYPLFNNRAGGLTLGETLYFVYIWTVGVNIPLVMDNAFKEKTKCSIVKDIFIRSFFLVLLGTAMDSIVQQQLLDCPLQKMGIAYFITATAYVLTVQRFEMKSKKIICKALTNLVCLLWCWIIAGFLLAILIILISTLISFNCMSNVRFEDQRLDNLFPEESQNCNNNFTANVNMIFIRQSLKLIGVNEYIGFSGGLMGIMSSIIYMLVGLKAGVVYLQHQSHSDRLILWSLWATVFGLGGICFAVVSYPLNFNLWPISSILVVASVALFFFIVTYILTEVWKFSSTSFSAAGVTSLVILCGHVLFSNGLPFKWGIHLDRHIFYILQNFWIILLWSVVAVVLMRRNVKFEV